MLHASCMFCVSCVSSSTCVLGDMSFIPRFTHVFSCFFYLREGAGNLEGVDSPEMLRLLVGIAGTCSHRKVFFGIRLSSLHVFLLSHELH